MANRYGDSLSAGWSYVMDVTVRLYRLELLPDSLWRLLEDEGAACGPSPPAATAANGCAPAAPIGGRTRRSRAAAASAAVAAPGRLASLAPSSFFRSVSSQISSLIALPAEPEFSGAGTAALEKQWLERAATALEACGLDQLFADSKFLKAESLGTLVQAVVWASGIPVGAAAAAGAAGGRCLGDYFLR